MSIIAPKGAALSNHVKRVGALPLIVNAAGEVISGNIWLEAAKDAGFSEIPVIVWPGLTQAEADVFMLAQVRLIERGTWDEKKLGEILRDLTLQDLDFDITLSGFDVAEMDLRILAAEGSTAEAGLSTNCAPHGPSVSRSGDIWIMRQASFAARRRSRARKLPTAHAWHARRHRVHRRAVQC